MTPAANFPLVSTTPAVPVLVAKFAARIVDTGGKFATRVIDTRGVLCLANIREFLKKFEMTLILCFGARGKMIHERNLKQNLVTLSR